MFGADRVRQPWRNDWSRDSRWWYLEFWCDVKGVFERSVYIGFGYSG